MLFKQDAVDCGQDLVEATNTNAADRSQSPVGLQMEIRSTSGRSLVAHERVPSQAANLVRFTD